MVITGAFRLKTGSPDFIKRVNIMEASVTGKIVKNIALPSPERLNDLQRLGLLSGGAVLTAAGLRKFKHGGWYLALAGGVLAALGATGTNPLRMINRKSAGPLDASAAITVNKDPMTVYQYWRKLENLPGFMEHLESVEQVDDRTSRWKANFYNVPLEWKAEILEDEPGKLISWRSTADSVLKMKGSVEFREAPNNSGTELRTRIVYDDEIGMIARKAGEAYKPVFRQQLMNELRRFKEILETGEGARTQS